MAGSAYADLDIATSLSGAVDGATRANDGRLYVFWVNIGLHVVVNYKEVKTITPVR